MSAIVVRLTAKVVMLKVAVVWPEETTAVAGTVAFELSEVRVTVIPPVGAAPFRVTVPVEGLPPITELGESETWIRTAGLIVRVVVTVLEFWVALIVAATVAETGVVPIANVADVWPDKTVTVAGKIALVLLLESVTTVPPVPDAPLRVTVPVLDAPPVTVSGETLTVATVGGVIVRIAVWVVPLALADIVAVVTLVTIVV